MPNKVSNFCMEPRGSPYSESAKDRKQVFFRVAGCQRIKDSKIEKLRIVLTLFNNE